MIDLNNRFIGLMIGLLLILAFFGYIAFFTEPQEEVKHKKSRS